MYIKNMIIMFYEELIICKKIKNYKYYIKYNKKQLNIFIELLFYNKHFDIIYSYF